MFYLTMPPAYFIYGYFGVRYMVSDHMDSGIVLLPLHGLHFLITANDLLYTLFCRQNNTYHCLWYTISVALVGTGEKPSDRHALEIRSCDPRAQPTELNFRKYETTVDHLFQCWLKVECVQGPVQQEEENQSPFLH